RLPSRPAARAARRRARARDPRPLDRPRRRLHRPRAERRAAHALGRRRGRAVGVPGRRHDRGREVRRPRPPPSSMSYTLRGRIESRLAAVLPALAVALALHRWWAIELVALMLALGLALDVLVYHRALPYQPGWAALPLGALELGLVYAAMRAIPVHAPLRPALALYAFAWVAAQICGHALFPRFQLSYAEDGGELRRAGPVTAISVAAVLACTAGVAYAMRPPTVHLRGVHRGPLVVSHAETLTGGVVHGTIVV